MTDDVTINISKETLLNAMGILIWVDRIFQGRHAFVSDAANELVDVANRSLELGLISEDDIEKSSQKLVERYGE